MKRTFISALGLIFCSIALFSQTPAAKEKSELIQGFRIEPDRIVFSVFTTGYTVKGSFKVNIVKGSDSTEIELIRIVDDFGKMMPESIEIAFSQDELKGRLSLKSPITVKNAFFFTKL